MSYQVSPGSGGPQPGYSQPAPRSNKMLIVIVALVVIIAVYYYYTITPTIVTTPSSNTTTTPGPNPIVSVAGLVVGNAYTMQSDIGTYLTRNGSLVDCGGANPALPAAKWTVAKGATDGTVNLVCDNGQYLAYCFNCATGVVKNDQAVISSVPTDWKPVQAADGSYSFGTAAGKFITRCNGCVGGITNLLTAHETGPNGWSSNFRLKPA